MKRFPCAHYEGCEIVDVAFDARTYVKGISARLLDSTNNSPIYIPCCTLLLVDKFSCDVELFTAINEAGVVFDGGLIVNKDFITNDSYIYGVGDFTRFSRRYKNSQLHSR